MSVDINRQAALISLDQELTKASLRQFVELAWTQVEPSRKFLPGWHLDAIPHIS